MKAERWHVALIAVMLLSIAIGAVAQEESEAEAEPAAQEVEETEAEPSAPPSTTFTSTVKFSPLNQMGLNGTAGEIDVRSVEFEVAGAKGGGVKGAFSSGDAEMQAIITTRLGCATTADTKVKFDMLIEFLDADGQVIDRVKNTDSLKDNDKVFDFKHTTLRWAVDHIDQARVTVSVKD